MKITDLIMHNRLSSRITINIILIFFVFSCYVTSQSCNNQFSEWISREPCPNIHIEGATAALGSKLYLFTGFTVDPDAITPDNTGGLVATDLLDIYDVENDTWVSGDNTPVKASHLQAAAWSNPPDDDEPRFIFIAGGFIGNHPGPISKQVWRYDTINDTWTRFPDLPEERASGGLVIDNNHLLHYIGGLVDRDTSKYLYSK
jgi:hypothetical protein